MRTVFASQSLGQVFKFVGRGKKGITSPHYQITVNPFFLQNSRDFYVEYNHVWYMRDLSPACKEPYTRYLKKLCIVFFWGHHFQQLYFHLNSLAVSQATIYSYSNFTFISGLSFHFCHCFCWFPHDTRPQLKSYALNHICLVEWTGAYHSHLNAF